MRVHIAGARGSTPATGPDHVEYGGDTACIAVGGPEGVPDLLIDAGSGLRRVDHLLGGAPFVGDLLLGHIHWDHVFGIPFFKSGDQPGAIVDVHMPDQGVDPESAIRRMMSPPTFPITPGDLLGRWNFHSLEPGEHKIGGYRVLAEEIPHKGGRTFGYRISDSTSSLAYLSDHSPVQLGQGPDGHGAVHPAALRLAEDVDLLIHDAQFFGDDWPRCVHYGHSTPTYAVRLGREARAGKVLLFHHDPRRTDRELDQLGEQFSGGDLPVLVARQGMEIDVGED